MLTYAIGVCDEALELSNLLYFLHQVKGEDDEINILVDIGKVNDAVRHVLEKYKNTCTICERKFDGNFSAHRNFHITQCKGDYIFMLDADEIPQEFLVHKVKQFKGDILYVPRINICPGYTQEFIKKHKFNVNNLGWINFPDYQGRVFKNNGTITWSGGVHEKLTGGHSEALEANPLFAMWHIKSTQKQDKQNAYYDKLN